MESNTNRTARVKRGARNLETSAARPRPRPIVREVLSSRAVTLPNLEAADLERACALLERLYDQRNVIHGKGVRVPSTFAAADLAWLDERGLAPNQRTRVTHDALVTRIVKSKRTRSIADAARLFVASLDADGPPHGAYLEAGLLAARMPAHRFAGGAKSSASCPICGLEREVVRDRAEEFMQWHRWGSGIPGDLPWTALALEQWPRGPAKPSPAARRHLAAILLALDGLPPAARAGAAFSAVRTLGLFAEDRHGAASRSVVETLAFAGILEAPPHVGMATRFVSHRERDARPTVRTEVDAPLGFWRGANGVSWSNAKTLFGVTKAAATRDAKRASPAAARRPPPRRSRPAAAKPVRGLPRRPAAAGDVWAVRVREDAWVLAYVWRTQRSGGRVWALAEYLDWFGSAPPEASALRGIGVRGRHDGRWQTRAHGLEKTTGLLLVAEKVPAPKTREPAPDRIPSGGAKDLIQLADWCFSELDEL